MNLLLALCILISSNPESVQEKYATIPLQNKKTSIGWLYEHLGIRDTNALIISITDNSYWHKAKVTNFLVFKTNGQVMHFQRLVFKEEGKKTTLSRKRIRKKIRPQYWNWLDSCITNQLFKLDQKQLDIEKKPIKGSRKAESLSVRDGIFLSYSIYLNRNKLEYTAYAPLTYINKDYPGKEERIKFLAVIDSFFELIEEE
jgi:hypothetical protein